MKYLIQVLFDIDKFTVNFRYRYILIKMRKREIFLNNLLRTNGILTIWTFVLTLNQKKIIRDSILSTNLVEVKRWGDNCLGRKRVGRAPKFFTRIGTRTPNRLNLP